MGERGPASDINLFRQQQAKFSNEQKFLGDKAYVGAARTTTPTNIPHVFCPAPKHLGQ